MSETERHSHSDEQWKMFWKMNILAVYVCGIGEDSKCERKFHQHFTTFLSALAHSLNRFQMGCAHTNGLLSHSAVQPISNKNQFEQRFYKPISKQVATHLSKSAHKTDCITS